MTKAQIEKWHLEGKTLAAERKSSDSRMVELLSLIAACDGFFHYHCDSLKSYAIYVWDLPDHAAAEMVTVANKSLEVPELIEALKRRTTCVSKLRRVCAVITPETQAEWIALAEECTNREIERAVAMAKPKPVDESMNYAGDDLVQLKAGISEKTMKNLKRLQDVLSQKERRAVSLAETIAAATELAMEKLDPVKKAERSKKKTPMHTARAVRPGKRQKISAHLVHAVNLRDQGQCTEKMPDGRRCEQRRWLHYHHIVPVALGGRDSLENLTTLCSRHHRLRHFS